MWYSSFKILANSTGKKRAEELNEPEPDTVDSEQATHNKPEERSELYNYNEIVRALNYDDNARSLNYDDNARALDYDEDYRP